MRGCRLAITGLVAAMAISAGAMAREIDPSIVALDGVSFADTGAPAGAASFNVDWREAEAARFAHLAPPTARRETATDNHRYEVAFGANRPAGLPVDVSISQRASFGVDAAGDIAQRGQGSELRLGRGVNMRRWQTPTWDNPVLYVFAASDDEALTWAPGGADARGNNGGWALQDRVEIGDAQVGITYEAGGLQASLAYVEREVSATTGARTISRDENFTGLTITMRR